MVREAYALGVAVLLNEVAEGEERADAAWPGRA